MVDDSPRFLAQKDPKNALRVLSKLRGLPPDHPYIQQEMGNIERVLEDEKQLMGSSSGFFMVKEAFTVKSYRRRSVLCITLMMWSNLTGTNAMTYYSPTIFASVGLSGPSIGLFATGIYGIVKMISCAIFIIFVSDSLGRRKSLLWTAVVQVSTALMLQGNACCVSHIQGSGTVLCRILHPFRSTSQWRTGQCFRLHSAHRDIHLRCRVPVWLGSGGLDVLLGKFTLYAPHPVSPSRKVQEETETAFCTQEIPPARLRPFNMGLATASQWIFNFIVAKCTPLMFANLGAHGYGTYFLYGAFCFTMVIYAWYFVPETKGR